MSDPVAEHQNFREAESLDQAFCVLPRSTLAPPTVKFHPDGTFPQTGCGKYVLEHMRPVVQDCTVILKPLTDRMVEADESSKTHLLTSFQIENNDRPSTTQACKA